LFRPTYTSPLAVFAICMGRSAESFADVARGGGNCKHQTKTDVFRCPTKKTTSYGSGCRPPKRAQLGLAFLLTIVARPLWQDRRRSLQQVQWRRFVKRSLLVRAEADWEIASSIATRSPGSFSLPARCRLERSLHAIIAASR